jgi:hypothetical protein
MNKRLDNSDYAVLLIMSIGLILLAIALWIWEFWIRQK